LREEQTVFRIGDAALLGVRDIRDIRNVRGVRNCRNIRDFRLVFAATHETHNQTHKGHCHDHALTHFSVLQDIKWKNENETDVADSIAACLDPREQPGRHASSRPTKRPLKTCAHTPTGFGVYTYCPD
jgi:hypothetical protein